MYLVVHTHRITAVGDSLGRTRGLASKMMRVLSPVVVTLLAGSLLYACEKSEALIWCSFGRALFRSRCLRLTSIPRHLPSCTPPPVLFVVNQHRGETTCLRRAGASSLRTGVAQRRTELRAKPRTDGQEPGTQGLSRQTKLAISVLIDLVGVSSYVVPGLGEVSSHVKISLVYVSVRITV